MHEMNDMTPRRRGGRRRGERPEYRHRHDAPLPHEGHEPGPRGGRRGHGPGGHGPGFGPRGRRGRPRGDVRAAILLLLDEQPRHGYELIQEIADRSSGTWSPSPGSIYPTLQALEDEGLVTIEKIEGRRTASLTEQGRAHVAEHRDRLGSPWTTADEHGPALALRREVLALKDAVAQVARVGTTAQQARATATLTAARKDLYRILAEDLDPEA